MVLDNVTSHFSTVLEPITSASLLSSLSIIHDLYFGVDAGVPCEQRIHFRGLRWRAKSSYFSLAISCRGNVSSARRVTQVWQNSRAVQREDPRAHLCRAFLLTLKSLPRIKNIGEDWERARIHLSTRSCQNYKTQTVVPKLCELQHFYIQLFRERLSEKLCTLQSRRVIWGTINTLFLTL